MITMHNIDRPLYLTDKLNLAHCALERSRQALTEKNRWQHEYDSMVVWMRHNCMTFGVWHYTDC